jgi:hypothetical protein
MRDTVRYALPCWPLGEVAHALVVRRDLEAIFDHRREAVAGRAQLTVSVPTMPACLVAGDRAVELVLAGLEVDAHGRLAARDGLRLGTGDAVDLHRVRDLGLVLERDRRLAGLGGHVGLLELERAARVRRRS